MGQRRRARELALQILYQIDIGGLELSEILEHFTPLFKVPEAVRSFCLAIVDETLKRKDFIDEIISRSVEKWSLSRLSAVDRNIIRMATGEMLSQEDIPASVTINEAIEIAKKFGSKESGAFVKGVLDRIRRDIGKK